MAQASLSTGSRSHLLPAWVCGFLLKEPASLVGGFDLENNTVNTRYLNGGTGWKVRAFDPPGGIVHGYFAFTVGDRIIERKYAPDILVSAAVQIGLVGR